MIKKIWSDCFEGILYFVIVLFNVSIGFDIELIEYDLDGSIVYGKMLVKMGIISLGEVE